MSSQPILAPDAAVALGIASTAIPFARTPAAEVERWLRVLRLQGHVGIALQSLGVSEAPFPASSEGIEVDPMLADGDGEGDTVARVTAHAIRIAGNRHARAVATTDLLLAVMLVYGDVFDRVLRAHGTDSAEVLERLTLQGHPQANQI